MKNYVLYWHFTFNVYWDLISKCPQKRYYYSLNIQSEEKILVKYFENKAFFEKNVLYKSCRIIKNLLILLVDPD